MKTLTIHCISGKILTVKNFEKLEILSGKTFTADNFDEFNLITNLCYTITGSERVIKLSSSNIEAIVLS